MSFFHLFSILEACSDSSAKWKVLEKHGSTLSDCNWTRTHNYLVHKQTLNHLAQLASWPGWLNGWVFVYELSGCGFQFSCSHLNFRFCACFEQGVPWHSGNYRVWIHSEMRMWHDKNITSCIIVCDMLFIQYKFLREWKNFGGKKKISVSNRGRTTLRRKVNYWSIQMILHMLLNIFFKSWIVSLNFHTYYLNSSICVWRSLVFQIVGKSHRWSMNLRMLGRGLKLKTTSQLVFFLWLAKSLKNL